MHHISPSNYYSQDVFEKEVDLIFSEQWLFACLTTDVLNKRDYFVIELFNKSVIIYNNGTEIKAFQNVCPHRFNRIFQQQSGNGMLICKYHLWGFNEEGKLIGKDKKDIVPQPINLDICLKQYRISVVGKFIFLNFAENPETTLDDQIGRSLKEELLLVSDILGEEVYEHTLPHKSNWKFIVENIVETQHCKAIHSDTLVRTGYCIKPPEFKQVLNNSYVISHPKDDDSRVKRDKLFSKYLTRPVSNNTFKHILFFPNFSLAISEGLIITIGQLFPISPESTDYKLRYFYSTIESNSPVATELLENMKTSVVDFNTQVFEEDRVMLEEIQKGVKEASHSGFMYVPEERLRWFTEAYSKIIT